MHRAAEHTPALREVSDYQEAYIKLKSAFEATLEIFSAQEAEQIVESLGRVLASVFPYVGSALLLRDPTNGSIYVERSHGFADTHRSLLDDAEHSEIAEWALREGRIATLPLTLGLAENRYTGVWVPLTARNERFGLLFIVLDLTPEDITEVGYNLLYLVATQTALALESRRLIENTRIQAEAIRNIKAYLESVLDSMPSGLLATDLDGRVTLFNRSAGAVLGVNPEECVGLAIDEALRADLAHHFLRALKAAQDGNSLEATEVELTGADGEKLPVRIAPSMLRDGEHRVIGMIFVVTDLREERELRELRHLDQLKDQFISTVSHELRTPITAIKSFAEILLTYDDPQHRREFLEIISRESDRLARLVNDILDLSKIKAGMMQWEIEELDIRQVIMHAIDSVRVLANEKSIRLNVEQRPEQVVVRGDRERLVQVMVNLLSNAIKFTPEGGQVTVGWEILRGRRRTDPGDFAKVWVRDTGVGIPKRYLPLIFDRFQQVVEGNGLKNRPKGTGLGLPISKEIVEHHGGNMWAESEEGKGSTFYFTIPMVKKVREVTKFSAPAEQHQPVEAEYGTGG